MSGGIVLVSDLHVSNHSAFAKELTNFEFPGINSRANFILEALKDTAKYAFENDCEAIVVPGDVYHVRKALDVGIHNALYRVFEEISDRIKLIVIPGNHDCYDLNSMYSEQGFNSLYSHNKVAKIIHSPEIVNTDNFSIALFPFNADPKVLVDSSFKLLEETDKNKITMAIYHHSIDGAVFGPHQYKMPHVLTPDDLPYYNLLFSGHIHLHQTIANKITYVGSLLQNNLGERNYTPGFIHISSEGEWKHIENKKSPRFKLITTADSKEIPLDSGNDYCIIRWEGDPDEGSKIKKENPNFRFELTPIAKTVVRTDIKVEDSIEKMFGKYIIAKTGQEDKGLLDSGIKLFKG